MASSSAFSQTLQYITSIKLVELERQRAACTRYVTDTLELAKAAGPDPIARVGVLIERIDAWTGLGSLVSQGTSLADYKAYLRQARSDPSITPAQVSHWADTLETQLHQAVTRYDYAKLFGDLLGEWLQSGDSLAVADGAPSSEPMRQEKAEQQDRIQELIFTPKHVDTRAIEEYLDELFSSPDASAVLENLRRTLKTQGETLLRQSVDVGEMEKLIKSLLARDLLSPEKAATLKGFLDNAVIIEEVTSVLNMQLARLDKWDWPEEGVAVEMRRHLSGKYRAYMDNEIMQALLFQHIGIQWSITFKRAFKAVAKSRAWKTETPVLSRAQLKRRNEQLGEALDGVDGSQRGGRGRGGPPVQCAGSRHLPVSIEGKRRALQLGQFFMTQLPDEMEGETAYDEEPRAGEKPNQGLNAQQVLLRLVSTEAHLKKTLKGSCTIMRADLEWFGPSLPHDSILTVFKFFGMSDTWVEFFRKWLAAKLRFGSDGVRVRSRGVPIAHSLSVLCGEAILFGMDFAVNQRAKGLYVYRIYDDFWYLSDDGVLCADAWREMNKYASLVGITFNMKKTGGVCVGSELEPSLPKGRVGWGFLVFEGRFVVDQTAVDMHIQELRRQLASAKSVFGYVNALNKYLEFFRRNFAQPARCFGQEHADEVVSTFARIQRAVFAETDGSVVRKIQEMVEARFGVKDIPAGWCFLPTAEGGLDVVNPIVHVLTVRDSLAGDPSGVFAEQMKLDRDVYEAARTRWNGEAEFMPWEEYILGRETRLAYWAAAWECLQAVGVSEDNAVGEWIVGLYSDEIMHRFGDLKIVEGTLIPVGMLSAFRNAKVAWDS